MNSLSTAKRVFSLVVAVGFMNLAYKDQSKSNSHRYFPRPLVPRGAVIKPAKSFLPIAYCENAAPFKVHPEGFEIMVPPSRSDAVSHAIFGQLMGPNLIERYNVYCRKDGRHSPSEDSNVVVIGDVHLGMHLDGHRGIVHGGILSLIIDDIMGFAYETVCSLLFLSPVLFCHTISLSCSKIGVPLAGTYNKHFNSDNLVIEVA
jgi:hypothetical protein